jgi:TPR repeat protein
MEGRPDVRGRGRCSPRRPARVRLFQSDRQYPSGGDSGHRAGAHRGQFFRCAWALLSHGHSQFAYAASYFGDADAQYQLGRLYLDGSPSDPHQAARWFQLAATKGDCRAEAVLGDMLFQGQRVPRQAARGLMWLTLGRDCAGAEENWIKPLYDNAFHRANDDERAMALVYLEGWLKGRRD